MIEAQVHFIGRFTSAQSGRQRITCAVISFVSAGQERMQVGSHVLTKPGPYLALLPAGVEVTYDYSALREQWAIMLDLPGLHPGPQADTVQFEASPGSGRIVLPMFTPIVAEHVSGWDGEFLRLREAFQAPCPSNHLRVQTGLGNILRYVLDQRRDVYPAPAAKLRWLIDEDQEARHSLEKLSRQCGYSTSRLRVLFERDYGLSPQAYRNQRRLSLAADLLCNSDQRIKEISQRVGCRQASHFSALFRSAFGLSPRAYQKKYRAH